MSAPRRTLPASRGSCRIRLAAATPDAAGELRVVPESAAAATPDAGDESRVVPESAAAATPDAAGESRVVPDSAAAATPDAADESWHVAAISSAATGASVERSRASASSADAGDREDRAGDGQRDRSPDGVSSSEREDDTFGSAARIAVRVTAGRDAGAPANTAEAAHQIDVAELSDTDELAGSESATDPPTDLAERSEAVDNPAPVAASVPPPAPPAPAAPPQPPGISDAGAVARAARAVHARSAQQRRSGRSAVVVAACAGPTARRRRRRADRRVACGTGRGSAAPASCPGERSSPRSRLAAPAARRGATRRRRRVTRRLGQRRAMAPSRPPPHRLRLPPSRC